MPRRMKEPADLRCSFCGIAPGPSRVVRGPGVAICDDCVERCVEIIRDRARVRVVER